MSALYEQMIRPSWGWWSLVKHRMPWWSCVCGPSNVLLHELAIYCNSTWYNIHTYIRVELLFSQKQKTALRAYSFWPNGQQCRSDKEIVCVEGIIRLFTIFYLHRIFLIFLWNDRHWKVGKGLVIFEKVSRFQGCCLKWILQLFTNFCLHRKSLIYLRNDCDYKDVDL